MLNRKFSKSFKQLIPWLLFLSLCLRSLVAPGYEFANVDENGEFSFGVVWCPGLNNIYALDQDDGHDHDHDHHQDDNSQSDDTEGDHFTATCGLWTGNASFISNHFYSVDQLFILKSEVSKVAYENIFSQVVSRKGHPVRAPPSSIFI
ncbi:MAG: hypothetical protein HKN08_09780 [Gammaproteobacteria bacterium]|nr:hypothetical protein [Gammaproteobacteria bacterium]